MFNPEKDFNRRVIEMLGRDGMSISSLAKELEANGMRHHRLILTGYLRALTDMNVLRERDVPPSKIYIPVRDSNDTIYESVEKSVRKLSEDPEEVILYVLHRMFKRPIFESELRMAGVGRVNGRPVDPQSLTDCKKILRRNGNVVVSETAYEPATDYPEIYGDVLADMILECKGSKHLVMATKQTKLM